MLKNNDVFAEVRGHEPERARILVERGHLRVVHSIQEGRPVLGVAPFPKGSIETHLADDVLPRRIFIPVQVAHHFRAAVLTKLPVMAAQRAKTFLPRRTPASCCGNGDRRTYGGRRRYVFATTNANVQFLSDESECYLSVR